MPCSSNAMLTPSSECRVEMTRVTPDVSSRLRYNRRWIADDDTPDGLGVSDLHGTPDVELVILDGEWPLVARECVLKGPHVKHPIQMVVLYSTWVPGRRVM